MEKEKTLRDELAMSLTADLMPTMNDQEAANAVSVHLGIEPVDLSKAPFGEQVQWGLDIQAAIRYAYADAMMERRAKR